MARRQTDFFEKYVTDGTAAAKLIESIHHYKVKGGNIIRLALNANATNTTVANSIDANDVIDSILEDSEDDITEKKGEKKQNTNTFACKSVADIVNVDDIPVPTPNIYFSMNDFFGLRRLSASCCALNGFFIDIDGHSIDSEVLPAELKKLEKLLNKKFNNGTLLVPTFMTKTGRGYGLFYVLQNSISCRGNTDKMIAFYDFEYQLLLRAFEDALNDTTFEVDTKVVDRSRVVRMPDTFNYKAGTYCRLCDYEGSYYSMGQIMDGCHLDRYIRHDYTVKKAHTGVGKNKTTKFQGKLPKALKRANIADYDDFKTKQMLLRRVRFIENLVAWKAECGKTLGYREEACFQYYNALVQLIERAEAKKRTRELNDSFLNPLPEKRLVCAFSPDNFRDDKRGLYGYYPFTNAKIIALFRNKDDELTYQKAAETLLNKLIQLCSDNNTIAA